MEEKLKILHLPMMYEWYDKIASGEKTTEYRQCSDHWNYLFTTKKYDLVRFQRGYYKNPANMLFAIKRIHKWRGANDLNQAEVWAIELGERID
uniref:hypothetical protein n=1 Tax=Candidatus Scatocola faecipullorum TaxID=2840917 RepID=UPI00402722A1